MKRFAFVLILVSLFLSGCGSKTDDEALENLTESLIKRWEYAETLPNEVTKEELLKTVEIELGTLEKYDIDDFKDVLLAGYLSSYRGDLNLIDIELKNLEINNPIFKEKWTKHLEERAYILYKINEKHELNIPEKYMEIFEDILANADTPLKVEKIKKDINENVIFDDLNIEVSDKSIALNYHTESALSANSFISHKTGFSSRVIDILKVLNDYDYEEIVISTTNNESIAVSIYFNEKDMKNLNFDDWDRLDSVDAYKVYQYSTAYHIRSGIWEELSSEVKRSIKNMNKQSSSEFWSAYGFTF